MTLDAELEELDAIATAELIRKREVTALEVLEACIARVERNNGEVNAVVFSDSDAARAQISAGLPDGPLAGVPFLLKDLTAEAAAMPLTAGSRFVARHHHVFDRDSEIVRRHRDAGLVILGRTNTSEFGILPTTEPALHGATRNPWDPTRTSGGSSGGAAAAVAARMVAVAHGSDGGGSIRIPASCCGVFGLKPSRGRNSLAPHGDIKGGLVAEHVISRSVRDSAALLDATRGPVAGDPYGIEAPQRPYLEETRAPVGPLRIGFTTRSLLGVEAAPECVDAVRSAAQLLSDLGHHVEEATPEVDGRRLGRAFATMWTAGAAWSLASWERGLGDTAGDGEVEPLTAALAERARAISAVDYQIALEVVQEQSRLAALFHDAHDLWLTPTLAEPPVPLGTFGSPAGDPMAAARRMAAFSPFTYLANVTGQPAMSVPLHWTAERLPVGVHFTARFGDEAMLFRLAAQLEEARPWARRRPAHQDRPCDLSLLAATSTARRMLW